MKCPARLAMKGATARSIQELAGHCDLSPTQKYMHLNPSAIVNAIQLLDVGHPIATCGDGQQMNAEGRYFGAGSITNRSASVNERPDFAKATSGQPSHESCAKVGEPGRNRTFNQQIKSLLLCQLSYGPTRGKALRRRSGNRRTSSGVQPSNANWRRLGTTECNRNAGA